MADERTASTAGFDVLPSSDAAPVAKPSRRTDPRLYAAQLIALALGLGAWEAAVRAGGINPIYLPAPSQVALAFGSLVIEPAFPYHLGVTLAEFAVGYGLAAISAIALGVCLVIVPGAERFSSPFLAASMSVPKVAIVPLLALWFGIGFLHKTVIVFLFAVFPVIYSTIAGVRQARNEHVRVARAFGAHTGQIIWKVLLPSAEPNIFAALRVSASAALVGALFAEILSSKAGLGNLISRSTATLDTPETFALVLIVTLLAVILVSTLDLAERVLFSRRRRTSK